MKKLTLSLATIIILMFVLGCTTAGTAPTDSTVQVRCEEDMPCWDSETMGNQMDGRDLLDDASRVVDHTASEELQSAGMDTYVGSTWGNPTPEDGQWAYASTDIPNLWHIFQM